MGREQRKWDRYPCRLKVTFKWGKRTVVGETLDLSFSGIFVVSDEPPPLRQLIEIELDAAEAGSIHILGMAVHHAPALPSRRAGFGVQLFGNDPASRKRWEELIARIRRTRGSTDLERTPEKDPADDRRPELRVAFNDEAGLRNFVSGDLARGVVQIKTPLSLDAGSGIHLVLVHPGSRATLALDAVVGTSDAGPASGLMTVYPIRLDRAKTSSFLAFQTRPVVSEDIYVTVDVPSEDIYVTVDLSEEAIRTAVVEARASM